MGTTVVGALFNGKKCKMFIGHVGDSRAYRVRGGQIQQMTRDHSLVNDYLLAMPELTDEQKSELPKNVITRALGMQDQVTVDLQSDDAVPGDTYVLCSDGLSGMIEDDEILEVVKQHDDLDAACKRLIAMANEHGGEDNITAVIVKIEGDPGDTQEISLSDTLRDQPEVQQSAERARAAAEAAEARKVSMADTPPAGVAAVNADELEK